LVAQPPPALSTLTAWALSRFQRIDPGTPTSTPDRDLLGLEAFAYQDLPMLKAALDDFDALPADTPNRANLAGLLAIVFVQSTPDDFDHEKFERAAALAEIAGANPDVPDSLRVYLAIVRSRALNAEVRRGTVFRDPRAIVAEYEGYRGLIAAQPAEFDLEVGNSIESTISTFTSLATLMENDPAGGLEDSRRLEERRDRTAPGSNSRLYIEALIEGRDSAAAARRQDYAAAQDAARAR
jgi:hypothetical protein